ncbi:hypothetical protein [Burkholderia pseudomallei]|uniref:hypothetical protein n=1 Tax=Burkholderia pseudomallei TaxID=28450 RepID=UPI000A1A02E7|nr:hypothetical protein [Burkholderia pseudomallei]ARK50031.1 hypothetical protein BOC35_28585 [Burkholderia pseudomallei]
MSNSTTLLDTIATNQAAKEVIANALFDAASPAMIWGRRASMTSGLTWGYYGGTYMVGTTANAITNGTVTLTASTTNYVYASATTGAVSVNTTGFPAGSIPLYQIVTSSTGISSYTDCRSYQPSAIAGTVRSATSEGSGIPILDAANSTAQTLAFKSLIGGAGVTVTDGGSNGLTISTSGTSGTVTGGSNEGSGVGVLDTASTTSSNLAFKTLVAGSGITITDNGSAGIAIGANAAAAVAPAIQQNGTTVVSAATQLNFQGAQVTNPAGSQAQIALFSGFGTPDQPPNLSNFTWVNQGSATALQEPWGISLSTLKAGGENCACLVVTAPSTPYQVVARMRTFPASSSYIKCGLLWRNSSSGLLQVAGLLYQSGFQYGIGNFNSPTSWNGFQGSQYAMTFWPDWHRIRDDGTNRFYDVSPDGVTWVNMYSFSRTTFLTPDQVGFFADPNGQAVGLSMFSWYAGA